MVDTTDIVTLEDMKEHLNVTATEDDFVIRGCMDAARAAVESWCGAFDDITGTIPAALIHALKMYAAHLYENREATAFSGSGAEVPMGFHDLIGPHRKWAFYDGEE